MLALLILLAVSSWCAYLVFGGPLWRRTSLRALRDGDDDAAGERLAAKVLPPLPAGSSDHMPRTRLDGALEILAIELERLLPMARDLDALWWQVRVASSLSSKGWAQGLLDRHARFERMALETLGRARRAAESLDPHSRGRLEDRVGELEVLVTRLQAQISARFAAEGPAPIEAHPRPQPEGLLQALELIGRTRQALRAPEQDPYR